MTESKTGDHEIGSLVIHPKKPEWGPARVLAVNGSRITVYFRDLPGHHPEDAVRTIDTAVASLCRADSQSDPLLDNLPPYEDGKFERPPRKRVTMDEGIEKFRDRCPLFFEDPAYIGDLKSGERAYKWAAHEQFVQTLGGGQLGELLDAGSIDELRGRALPVEGRLNLLSKFEKPAFRYGLKDDDAAREYFSGLLRVLETPDIERPVIEDYFKAVENLPAEEGKTSPAKWTVATLLPYIAQPDRFMFLKPEVTQDCAARLTYELQYRPQLNWFTYEKLLRMSKHLLDVLRPYGARDFIDVQSFIWVIGGGWDS